MNRLSILLALSLCGVACSPHKSEKSVPAPTTIVPSFETEQAQAAPPKKTDVELQRRFEHAKLSLLVWVEQHPKSAKTWFALEQRGTLSRFDADGGKKQIALDITDRVRYGGERGLLGMAFHPTFPEAPFIYVNYTHDDKSRGLISRVSRFKTKDKGKTFDPGSEKVLLSYEQPYGNHNGGQILFGPDKMLYIGVGDGGSGGDPKKHGQNTKTLLGTILRIDVNKEPYGIPADNPFAKQGGRKEIYAYGLRNPWRMSFDRKTGDLWVGDVGQNAYEEINVVQKGKNYGWRTMEGTHCFDPEEGWGGGEFYPHHTHQNGLSVDFMVPVRRSGESVPVPTSIIDGFGYLLEFNSQGKLDEYNIDFEAIAAHLLALEKSGKEHGVKIKRIILAPELQKKLFKSGKAGRLVKRRFKWNKKQAWVRHDDHYHVDFVVSDKANEKAKRSSKRVGD